MELLAFFVIGPTLAVFIAYKAWRAKVNDPMAKRYGLRCLASGVIAILLFGFAKWINADFRAPEYLLQLACVLLSFLSFGVCMGYFFSALLDLWRWHESTRLN